MLSLLIMAMVSFAGLVVVEYETNAGPTVKQPISEVVLRTANRIRYEPQRQFRNGAVIVMALPVKNTSRPLHMT